MATIRVEKSKENPYVILNKTGLNDPNLSWKAKGILAYLLSKPDDWKCMVNDLIKHSKDGRDATYAGLKELREHGYMIKRPLADDKGKIVEWQEVLYEMPQEEAKKIFEEQQDKREKNKIKGKLKSNNVDNVDNVDNSDTNSIESPYTENPDMGNLDENLEKPYTENPDMENPDTEKPHTENPEILLSTDLLNTDSLSTEGRNNESDPVDTIFDWNLIKKSLKNKISETSFNTWINTIEDVKIYKGYMHIYTRNSYYKDILEQKYKNEILTSVLENYPKFNIDIKIH